DQDRVDDREREERSELTARAEEVVALRERATARDRRRTEHDLVLWTAHRLGPRAQSRQRWSEVLCVVGVVMQETPALVRSEGEKRELNRHHIRSMLVNDCCGTRRDV